MLMGKAATTATWPRGENAPQLVLVAQHLLHGMFIMLGVGVFMEPDEVRAQQAFQHRPPPRVREQGTCVDGVSPPVSSKG